MKRKLNEIELLRWKKLENLKSKKIEPFSKDIKFLDNSKSLNKKYYKYTKNELEQLNKKTSIVFRIMKKRGPFFIGKDFFSNIQVYFKKDLPSKVLELKKLLDIGDIVKVGGVVMKTNTNNLSIKVENLKLITKSLKPLPEKFHGLKNIEERYRRRYVDLIINDNVKKIFWNRSKIISNIRKFFDNLNYMEVDTPILSSILGGAAAKPFKTHHNAFNIEFYLRIATELPLKKLLVGGIERVYEIGRLFRNEGIDTTHNPEFTTIEFYEAYSNLEGMMKRTEELFTYISKVLDKKKIEYNGENISLKTPFQRLKMIDSISNVIGINLKNVSYNEIKEIAKKNKIKIEPYYKKGHIINALFENLVEKTIINPTFVYGYPIEISPLAAKSKENEEFVERAELFINGKEYANMFTELNDPIDQYQRFKNQLEEAKAGNEEANEFDMDFIEALEYGMPPAGGCGIGIDRLVMLFTSSTSIKDVLLFPHLKNKLERN